MKTTPPHNPMSENNSITQEGESPSLHKSHNLVYENSVQNAHNVPYISSHTSPTSRAHLYSTLTSHTVPILTIADANEYLTRPPVLNAFFPSCPLTASRSIALTQSFFYVKTSSAVPMHLACSSSGPSPANGIASSWGSTRAGCMSATLRPPLRIRIHLVHML